MHIQKKENNPFNFILRSLPTFFNSIRNMNKIKFGFFLFLYSTFHFYSNNLRVAWLTAKEKV